MWRAGEICELVIKLGLADLVSYESRLFRSSLAHVLHLADWYSAHDTIPDVGSYVLAVGQRVQSRRRAAIQQRLAEADAPVAQFVEWGALLVQAALVAEGYYRYQRGPWRRRASSDVQRTN
jgi:hypothetical protein